jgi:hypothetical protein
VRAQNSYRARSGQRDCLAQVAKEAGKFFDEMLVTKLYEPQSYFHARLGVESLLPLRFSQASPDDQHIERHHRDHAECNYVFHFFVHLICVTGKARRPQGRAEASALQDNLGTNGPSGRTGNRAPRSKRQLHSLSECDAHQEPADSPVSREHSIDRDIHSSLGQHLFS